MAGLSLRALILAAQDMLRPRIFRVLALGVLLSIGLLIALQVGVFLSLRWLLPATINLPLIGAVAIGAIASWGSLILFPVIGFFLMAPVAAAFSGLFVDRVAVVVEGSHYPGHPGRDPDFWDAALESLAIAAAALLIALVSLILTPFLGPLAPVLFYGANGWLLGREFFHMSARRHLSDADATALRQELGAPVTGLGVMIAFLLTVPVLNVTIPVLAAAAFTHLFHLSQRTPSPYRG